MRIVRNVFGKVRNVFDKTFVLMLILAFFLWIVAVFHDFHAWGMERDVEIYRSICSAVLSVVITALITCCLLKSQSNNDTEKERDSRVYEQKLNIFIEFLNEIRSIVEDGKIMPEEANSLKFTFAKVALHLPDEKMAAISKLLSQIVKNCDALNSKPVDLGEQLMEVVYIIREELYPMKAKDMKSAGFRTEVVNNMKVIDNKVERTHTPEGKRKSRRELLETLKSKLSGNEEDLKLWTCAIQEDTNLIITSRDSEGDSSERFSIQIQMVLNKDSIPYYRINVSSDSGTNMLESLYPDLQNEFGGSNSNDYWSKLIDGERGKVIERGVDDVNAVEDIAGELLKMVKFCHLYILTYDRMLSLKNTFIKEHEGKLKNWNWRVFSQNGILIESPNREVTCSFRYANDNKIQDLKLSRESTSEVKWKNHENIHSDELMLSEVVLEENELTDKLSEVEDMYEISSVLSKANSIVLSKANSLIQSHSFLQFITKKNMRHNGKS